MVKIFKKLSIVLSCVAVLCGCNSTQPSTEDSSTSSSGFSDLVGEWEVSGIYYKNHLIDIHDVDGFEDLYDTYSLTIKDDNTYVLMNNVFGSKGQCTQSTSNSSLYYLKGESVFRYSYENGELVQKEMENSTPSSYSVLILGDDHNAINVQEVDSTTLKAKTDSNEDLAEQKIYIKKGTESEYLAANKLDTSSSSSSSSKSSSSSSSSQTVNFTNEYGTATTICAHTGCNNYIASSGDTNCCTEHSNKCLKCGKYIDEDATYCMDCLSSSISNSSKKSSSSSSSSSLEEKNALSKAHDYLAYMAFSYSGLIEQLEYEGFSSSAATYAVDNCGADWNEQAAKKAQEYLNYSSFSRQELIDQLEFEGFSSSQAEYGVSAVGY